MDPQTLRHRLRGVIAGNAQAPVTPAPIAPAQPAREEIARAPLESALGGEWRQNGHGRSFVVMRRFAPDHAHGAHRVEQFAHDIARSSASPSSSVSAAVTAEAPFLFFDLET